MCDLQREIDVPSGPPDLEAKAMMENHVPRGGPDHYKWDTQLGGQALHLTQHFG